MYMLRRRHRTYCGLLRTQTRPSDAGKVGADPGTQLQFLRRAAVLCFVTVLMVCAMCFSGTSGMGKARNKQTMRVRITLTNAVHVQTKEADEMGANGDKVYVRVRPAKMPCVMS